MFLKHISRIQGKINNNEDISKDVQTMANMIKGFFCVPEFYSLPKEVIFDTFSKSKIEFSKTDAIYAVEWIKFVVKKKMDSTIDLIQKRKTAIFGPDIVEITQDWEKWEESEVPLPPEPLVSEKNVSQIIIDMTKMRQKAEIDAAIANNGKRLDEMKVLINQVGTEQARVNKMISEAVKETMVQKFNEEKSHNATMRVLNESTLKLQRDLEEVTAQASQTYTQEGHKMLMSKLKSEHKEVIQGLNARLAAELEEIQDAIAVVNGGKTSKELAEEKAKKDAEEKERKKKGIPENFAPFIPKKPIVIKPLYKPKTTKKPTKIRTIFDAIVLNDFDAVKTFVEKSQNYVKELSDGRITPLHQACKCNLPEVAEYLIDNGADINAKDVMKMTPLHYACIEASDELIKLLMAKGADTQVENSKKQKPGKILELRDAAQKTLLNALEHGGKENKKAVVEIFKEWPDFINHSFSKGMRPIHLAAGFGQPEMIELLLQYGADIETLDMKLNTPLHYAAMYGKIDSVKYLLEHGANYHAINADEKFASDLLPKQQEEE